MACSIAVKIIKPGLISVDTHTFPELHSSFFTRLSNSVYTNTRFQDFHFIINFSPIEKILASIITTIHLTARSVTVQNNTQKIYIDGLSLYLSLSSPIVDIEKVRGETTAGGVYSNCYFHLFVWLLYQVERVTKFFHLYFKKKKKKHCGVSFQELS